MKILSLPNIRASRVIAIIAAGFLWSSAHAICTKVNERQDHYLMVMASALQEKPLIKKAIFDWCIPAFSENAPISKQNAFYAPDVETLNWFMLAGFHPTIRDEEGGDIYSTRLLFSHNPELKGKEVLSRVKALPMRKELEEKYKINFEKLKAPTLNSKENKELTYKLLNESSVEWLEKKYKNRQNTNLLHLAVAVQDEKAVEILLKRSPKLLWTVDERGFSPFVYSLLKSCNGTKSESISMMFVNSADKGVLLRNFAYQSAVSIAPNSKLVEKIKEKIGLTESLPKNGVLDKNTDISGVCS